MLIEICFNQQIKKFIVILMMISCLTELYFLIYLFKILSFKVLKNETIEANMKITDFLKILYFITFFVK